MTAPGPPSVREELRSALVRAMKRRDRVAVSAYRGALAALDNAEALPLTDEHRASAIEASATGAGSTDAHPRSLTEEDMAAILRDEVESQRSAAAELHDRHEAPRVRALPDRMVQPAWERAERGTYDAIYPPLTRGVNTGMHHAVGVSTRPIRCSSRIPILV